MTTSCSARGASVAGARSALPAHETERRPKSSRRHSSRRIVEHFTTASGAPVLDEIRRWLLRSGVAGISLAALESDLPRWPGYLRARGVTGIPPFPSTDPRDAHATNLLCLLLKQAKPERVAAEEHDLRNLAQVRPHKV